MFLNYFYNVFVMIRIIVKQIYLTSYIPSLPFPSQSLRLIEISTQHTLPLCQTATPMYQQWSESERLGLVEK